MYDTRHDSLDLSLRFEISRSGTSGDACHFTLSFYVAISESYAATLPNVRIAINPKSLAFY